MKKNIFIFILIVLYAELLFPQAVDIPLTATDGTYTINLNVGLDLSATNCIDTSLGEIDLPPIPPAGIFDICFDLSIFGCPPIHTLQDYRPPGDPPAFPFTGVIQHRLLWQRSEPGLPIEMTFDLPTGASMTITDEFGGTLLNLGPFVGQGSFTIPGSLPLNAALLVMQYDNISPEPVSEPAVNIQFTVTDGIVYPFNIYTGLDLNATDCIDPQLGEYDFQVYPPAGVFDIRFLLDSDSCAGAMTYMDYRAPGDPPAFPFSDTVVHHIIWQTSAPGELPVDITYNLPPGAEMIIQDLFGGIIFNLGPFEGQGVAIIPGNTGSDAYLYMIYTNIIPVELTSFTASVAGKDVQLNWTTATETNNRGFEVEKRQKSQPKADPPLAENVKSQNGWKNIGFVGGNGTTTEPKTYSFLDENVTGGSYRYRLKQIDFDGSYKYSNEVEVNIEIPLNFSLEQNYPNPFNPGTTIKFALPEAAEVTLTIYNTLGQKIAELVNSKLEAGNYSYEWNARNVSTGMYIYELRTDKYVSVKKMLLLK